MRIKDKSIKKIVVITIIIFVPLFSHSASFASPHIIETSKFGTLLNNVFCSTIGAIFNSRSCKIALVIDPTPKLKVSTSTELVKLPTVTKTTSSVVASSRISTPVYTVLPAVDYKSYVDKQIQSLRDQLNNRTDFNSKQTDAIYNSIGKTVSNTSSSITNSGSFSNPTITGGSISGASFSGSFSGSVDVSTLTVTGEMFVEKFTATSTTATST